MPKTILILSGGMDSVTLLYHLKAKGHILKALTIDYGQRHRKEIQYAQTVCKELMVEHQVASLTGITHLLGGSSQTDPNIPVPEGHYEEESMKLTVVPNRNMIMLSVAIGWAITEKADNVAYAAHAGDHAIYPDCRPEFADKINEIAQLADWHKVELIRPFIGMDKGDIAKRGQELGLDYTKTWTCYKGLEKHCGKCGACQERQEAFKKHEVPDPTLYE